MTEILVAHACWLAGSILAATLVTLLPYYKKVREAQAVGETIHFDRKFLMTAFTAFIVGAIAGLLSFDENVANIDTNATPIKIFATAFGATILANAAFNALIKPSSSLVTAINTLKDQNQQLKSQVQRLNSEKP
jgi:uncharacterized membrane protein